MAYRILLIEDHAIILMGLEGVAEDFGYTFSSATNMAEAAQLLHERQYDAVLTDFQFPLQVGGVAVDAGHLVVKWLQDYAPDTPYIIQSGASESDIAATFKREGIVFNPDRVVAKLDGACKAFERLTSLLQKA
jgi:CheY-like chemotaxis protein